MTKEIDEKEYKESFNGFYNEPRVVSDNWEIPTNISDIERQKILDRKYIIETISKKNELISNKIYGQVDFSTFKDDGDNLELLNKLREISEEIDRELNSTILKLFKTDNIFIRMKQDDLVGYFRYIRD